MLCKCGVTLVRRLSCNDVEDGICGKCGMQIEAGNYEIVVTDDIIESNIYNRLERTQSTVYDDDSFDNDSVLNNSDCSNDALVHISLKQKQVVVVDEHTEFPLLVTTNSGATLMMMKRQIDDLTQQVTLLAEKDNERHTFTSNEIPDVHNKPNINVNDDFKDSLLASLYSQCEFLRKELEEKNVIIRALLTLNEENDGEENTGDRTVTKIDTCHDACNDNDHLRVKLMENNEEMKNITLNNTFLQDENQKLKNHIKQIKESGSEVEMQTCKELKSEFNTFRNDLDNFKKFITENISANTVEPTTSKDTNMGVPTAATQLKQYQENHKTNYEIYKNTKKSKKSPSQPEDHEQLGAWEGHNKGTATKIMKKFGYAGKGLGKHENGIVEPIGVNIKPPSNKQAAFDLTDANRMWPRNTILITGSSLLRGIDENTMSRKYNVKVRPHPGATTLDMYDHLNAHLKKKPDYLILNVGTNDASNEATTSDLIFNELLLLKQYAEERVPGIKVTISCPPERLDNQMANVKIMNLRNELMNSGISCILNDNICHEHLNQKGLHLTKKGTSRLARNLIDFMQRL